jgi:hypothetical protein
MRRQGRGDGSQRQEEAKEFGRAKPHFRILRDRPLKGRISSPLKLGLDPSPEPN